jgi:hypothetical protein
LDNTIFAIGSNLSYIDKDSAYNPATNTIQKKTGNNYTAYNSNPIVDLVLNKNGLYIKGSIYASAFIASATNGYFKATGENLGFYNNSNNAILTINSSAEIIASEKLRISADNLYIGNDNYTTIATNIINSNMIESLKMYRIWNSDSNSTGIITGAGTTTIDTNWQEKVPIPTNANKYIWSVMRYKRGDNKYYYSTP